MLLKITHNSHANNLGIEPREMDRKQLKIILGKLGYSVSQTQVTEAFLKWRGDKLEKSQEFNFDALAQFVIKECKHSLNKVIKVLR